MSNYTPNEKDFDEWDNELSSKSSLDTLSKKHPILYSLSKKLSEHPNINKAVDILANSPTAEAGISGGTGLINAFRNMANVSPWTVSNDQNGLPHLEPRSVNDKPLLEPLERPFPEPTSISGKIGSTIGDIAGSATAFAAIPGSSSVPGALATAYSQGEGGYMNRLKDALIGLVVPGLLHTKSAAKTLMKGRNLNRRMDRIDLQKAKTEKEIFSKKEDLASKINERSKTISSEQDKLKNALETLAGNSESVAKQQIGTHLKNAESAITKKYNNLYEDFNASEAGQTGIKEKLDLPSLISEYGLNPEEFSKDTQNLISKLIGKKVQREPSKIISSETNKPVNEAKVEFESAKNPKVSEYINLWKQTRAEVSDLKHSQQLASTPEAKRRFREESKKLERFSDTIHERAMNSLSQSDRTKYSELQRGFLNERVPFLEKPVLKNATDKFPEVPDNFFDKLNSLGTPELLKTIKKDFPELSHAITKHDIRNVHRLSSEALQDMVKSDFGRFISPDIAKSLGNLSESKNAEQALKNALGKVQSTEITRKVRSKEIDDIVKQHPSLGKPFKNLADEQEKLRKFKDILIHQGYKQKEITEELKKYKSGYSIGKAIASPIAGYYGIKKSVGKSNSEQQYNE